MTSIRKRLLLSILAVLTLATTSVGMATYLGIRHEMDELYDANMRQLAFVAAGMVSDAHTSLDNAPALSQEWPRGEEIFLIQIWRDKQLVYSSHPAVDFALQERPGFGRLFFHDKKWHYYQEKIGENTVQVAQNLRERREVIREVYNAIIIPELIQFPLLFAVIWLLVGYGLRPLDRISGLIQERTATFMNPIPLRETPQEIRSLVVALNNLLGRLGTSMEAQRRFTVDAAHELRTPLTAVRLQLDLLQRAQTDRDRLEAVQALENGVSRSIHLVQQLLELARQEPDNANQPRERINLADIVRTIEREQNTLAQAKSLNIHTDLQNAWVHGISTDLSVMAGNLLCNAIAYTQEGGDIFLRTYIEGNTPALEIADNGIGIPEAERERIFDRFYRIVGTGTTGSGLGLSIVKTIAEKHGIKIMVSGGPAKKGTTFRIFFPTP